MATGGVFLKTMENGRMSASEIKTEGENEVLESDASNRLGPKAEKIKERIRNNFQDEEEEELNREEKGMEIANLTGKHFTDSVREEEGQLLALLKHGCWMVGNVEVAALSSEVSAVVEEEQKTQKWRETLKGDEEDTQQALRKVKEDWEATLSVEVPETLYQKLLELKDMCTTLTEEKQRVIDGLRDDLQTIDMAYNSERLQHSRERSELLRRITEHVFELHKAYRDSLENLQTVAHAEHEKLVEYYGQAWDASITELDGQLHKLLRTRLEARQDYEQKKIDLRLHGSLDQEGMKEKLEKNVEQVLLELSKMKVRRQLEESQLRYNVYVLQQQHKETIEIVSQQRRQVNSLRHQVTKHKNQVILMDKAKSQNDASLRRQITSMKLQSKELRKMLENSRKQGRQQVRGVKMMHFKKVEELITQMLEIERRIERGVLAREWMEPDLSALQELNPLNQPKETSALKAAAKILAHRDDETLSVASGVETFVEEEFLVQLARESQFFLDIDVKNAATRHQPLLMLEHVFWELGIQNEGDIKKLLDIARKRGMQLQRAATEKKRSSMGLMRIRTDFRTTFDEEEGYFFSSDDVLEILREFCQRGKKKKIKKEERKVSKIIEDDEKSFLDDEDGDWGEEEEDEEVLEDKRWTQFGAEMTATREKTWQATKKALEKYHAALLARREKTQKVESLRSFNKELAYLLQNVKETAKRNRKGGVS